VKLNHARPHIKFRSSEMNDSRLFPVQEQTLEEKNEGSLFPFLPRLE